MTNAKEETVQCAVTEIFKWQDNLLWVDIFSKDSNVEGEGGTMWVLGNECPRNKAKPEQTPPDGCNYNM